MLSRIAVPSVEFAASYRTSRHAGGDYYDVLDLGSDRFGIMVADVSGHGARSAIVMAMIRTLLHMHPTPDNPPTVLRHINEHFCYLKETGIFATAIYSVLDLQRRVLRLSCAGHPRPLRVRASGDVETIPVDAVVPLLLMEIDDVPCIEQQLASGDRVLFYTDGITERQASNGSMYEEHRLVSALRSVARLDATAIVDYLVNDVNVFGAGSDPEDDQTLLVTGLMA